MNSEDCQVFFFRYRCTEFYATKKKSSLKSILNLPNRSIHFKRFFSLFFSYLRSLNKTKQNKQKIAWNIAQLEEKNYTFSVKWKCDFRIKKKKENIGIVWHTKKLKWKYIKKNEEEKRFNLNDECVPYVKSFTSVKCFELKFCKNVHFELDAQDTLIANENGNWRKWNCGENKKKIHSKCNPKHTKLCLFVHFLSFFFFKFIHNLSVHDIFIWLALKNSEKTDALHEQIVESICYLKRNKKTNLIKSAQKKILQNLNTHT